MSRREHSIIFALVVGLCVALIGGAVLFVRVSGVARTNSNFICAFGTALTAEPIQQRKAETVKEFQQRVALITGFISSLEEELADCDVPAQLTIHPDSKKALESVQPEEVDAGSGDSPSGPSGPSEQGGRGPRGPRGKPGEPAPQPSPQPDTPGRPPTVGQGVGGTVDGALCQLNPQHPSCV